MFETRTGTVPITKEMVKAAYRKVKANHGSAGIDKESLEMYETDLLNNLYVLWSRLSSGSYFPKPLRSVSIPKSPHWRQCSLTNHQIQTKFLWDHWCLLVLAVCNRCILWRKKEVASSREHPHAQFLSLSHNLGHRCLTCAR